MRALLVVLLFAGASSAANVSATRMDSRTVAGELKSWDDEFAVLETADGEQRIAVNELLSLRWLAGTPGAESGSAVAAGQVELIDGSVLPISEFRGSASRANVTLAGPASSHTLTIAKRQIAAVRLLPLDAALVEQWNEIREIKPAADVIVLKREGQSLDYMEGVLGDVSPEKVAFEFDGEAVKQIDRKKVAGFIYFRGTAAKQPEPRFVVQGRSGFQANVAHATLIEDVLRVTTAGGMKLDWPLEDIEVADFSAGKLVYLSDLEPASKSSTPLVALPDGTSQAGKYAEPRRDHSAYGGPLSLASGDDLTNLSNAGIQSFNKGLAVRSRTELVYRLPAGFRRLNAMVGIEPATRASGHVRLEIIGDERPLLSADIAGTDPPRSIDLDIAGVKRLKFIVDYGKNLDTGDWLNLGDLRVVK